MEENETEAREKDAVEHGHPVSAPCEKCYDSYDYGPPVYLGGSTSFEELKAYREAQKVENVFYIATLDYRDLSANILNDPEISVEDKASKLIALTQEFQDVVTNVDDYYEDFKEREEKEDKSVVQLPKKKGFLASLFGKKEEAVVIDPPDFSSGSGFKIFKQGDGSLRWLSYSSNAFQDLDGEIVSTKALEDAVADSDKSGERGPLRIFHVPGTDIGETDYQAVAGRFLIESGTFYNDELGQKATEYFLANQDKEFQVSIGFTFKVGDEGDGVYEWVRIFERSVCPNGDAANPFTSFALSGEGGKEMDERKMGMLKDIFGEDLASKIVGKAESQTKELEQSAAYKTIVIGDAKVELPEEAQAELKALVEKYANTEDKGADDKSEEKTESKDEKSEDKTEGKTEEKASELEIKADFAPIAAALEAFTEQMAGIQTLVTSLQGDVNEMKEKQANSPKAKSLFRASSDEGNLVDPEKIKEITGDEKPPVNAAQPYIEDLLGVHSN